jgi:hypothetical protein
MNPAKLLALAALAAPAAVVAQPSYVIREYVREPAPLVREELRDCMDRDRDLARRDTQLATEKRLNDREGASIARASAQLADDLRRLDNRDTVAVAAHNARAEEHNRRVEAHNLRVYDQNQLAANLNRDQADQSSFCGARTYYRSDRDAIVLERRY